MLGKRSQGALYSSRCENGEGAEDMDEGTRARRFGVPVPHHARPTHER